MSQWIRLCSAQDAPKPGEVKEAEAAGVAICLANVNGSLAAVDNWCPHRRASLGQGWLEGSSIVCPAHLWTFSTVTGLAEPPERARITVFPLKELNGEILIGLD